MDTTVKLQPPFSYSPLPIIIILFIIFILSIFVIVIALKNKNNIPKVIEIKEIDKKNIPHIKKLYISRLCDLEHKLQINKISVRSAYQSMSVLIRYFVYEVTNIKVQNYTLQDIEKLNMPVLYELIQEYYSPEFAEHSLGNVQASIERTRKAIEKWN